METMARDYDRFTDEELIHRLRDGDSPVMDYLIEKYKYLVRAKAKSMFILGGDNDDLIQEGMLGLFKAVRDYDSGRDASFLTFAELCVSRQIYTAVQASQRKKHIPLNTYISLSGEPKDESGDGEEKRNYEKVLEDKAELSPEEVFLDKERVEYLEQQMDKELSPFEKQVLDLHLTGMSYTQIARVLGREEKATDNALQRLKSKIRKML
ncbi:MAG: RNA polymerase sporulation sigma factor SigH [Lachnospiraceae bacterium]|nr:RNA polymerase sporulation sigma factor SigH [Lachnospiraceae bacterium]MBQ8118881.1 RNA polymerase sporulation sigma factor SigH [Lachnospiraceae bacterium]